MSDYRDAAFKDADQAIVQQPIYDSSWDLVKPWAQAEVLHVDALVIVEVAMTLRTRGASVVSAVLTSSTLLTGV